MIVLERFGLTAGPVQSQHQLTAGPFAQRVAPHEIPQLADELMSASTRQISLQALLDRAEPKLLELRDRCLRERLICEVRQRRAPPQRQRFAQ